MAELAFFTGEFMEGWDGIWALLTFGYQGGTWSGTDVLAVCRHKILGGYKVDPTHSDLYLWAAGRFRMSLQRSPQEIDLEHFYDGRDMGFPTVQNGIFSITGDELKLCLAFTDHSRPTSFALRKEEFTTLGELVRCSSYDS